MKKKKNLARFARLCRPYSKLLCPLLVVWVSRLISNRYEEDAVQKANSYKLIFPSIPSMVLLKEISEQSVEILAGPLLKTNACMLPNDPLTTVSQKHSLFILD